LNLYGLCESIECKSGFVRFIQALTWDLRENECEWQNVGLEDFLESLGAWVDALENLNRNTGRLVPENFDWKFAAELLVAGKIYE